MPLTPSDLRDAGADLLVPFTAEMGMSLAQDPEKLEGEGRRKLQEVQAWLLPFTHKVSPWMSNDGQSHNSTRPHTNPSGRTVAAARSGFQIARGLLSWQNPNIQK